MSRRNHIKPLNDISLFFSASSLKVQVIERAKLHPWEVKKGKKRKEKKRCCVPITKKKQSKCILFVVRRIEKVLIRAHERGAGKKKGKGEDGQKGRTRVEGRKQEKISKVKRGEELRSGIFCCGSNCVPLRPL